MYIFMCYRCEMYLEFMWILLNNVNCECRGSIFTHTLGEIKSDSYSEIWIPQSSLCSMRFLSPLGVLKCVRVSFLFGRPFWVQTHPIFQTCEASQHWVFGLKLEIWPGFPFLFHAKASGQPVVFGGSWTPNHPKPMNLGSSNKFVFIPTVNGSRPAGRAIEYISVNGYERSI